MKRQIVWIPVTLLIVTLGFCAIAFEVFYFELRPILPGKPSNQRFEVAFDWNNGVQSLRVVNLETGTEERDRKWRRLVRSTIAQDLPRIMDERRVKRAKGKVEVHFDGYGIVLDEDLAITDPNFQSFWTAAAEGDVATISAMLADGMDVNVDASSRLEKKNALMIAAEFGNNEIAKTLVARGADVNAGEQNGQTPVMLAAVEGHEETVRILLSAGANVNARDKYGGSVLFYAVWGKRSSIVEMLLASGAAPDGRDEFGRSPLMYAAERECEDIVRTLLAAGADALATDREGNSALSIAIRKGNRRFARLLRNSPAASGTK